MAPVTDDENMVKYQFQADDEEWAAWKRTVPREKSLEQRINELIRADTAGRVGQDLDVELVLAALDDLETAMGRGDRELAADALERARDELLDQHD